MPGRLGVTPRCDACRFWDRKKGTENGVCRKNVPQVDLQSNLATNGVWPITKSQDWCGDGEFKANA